MTPDGRPDRFPSIPSPHNISAPRRKSGGRGTAREVLSEEQEITLDVTMISKQGEDLAAWYTPANRRGPAVIVFLDYETDSLPYGGARRGDIVKAKVRTVLDNCAFARVTSVVRSFLDDELGRRYTIVPTGISPFDARDSVSVPAETGGKEKPGYRGVPVVVKRTNPFGEFLSTIDEYCELEEDDLRLLGLDSDKDRYLLTAITSGAYERPVWRQVYVAPWQPGWEDLPSNSGLPYATNLIHERIRGVPKGEYTSVIFFGDNGEKLIIRSGINLSDSDPRSAIKAFNRDYHGSEWFRLALAEPPHIEALKQAITDSGLMAVNMPSYEWLDKLN